jgi:hypothetical protein
VANITDRMQWPYPEEDADPWFDDFQAFATQVDASGYASREDRHLILSSTATFSFVASSGALTWSAGIDFVNMITGHVLTIPAGSVVLSDGQMAYLVLTRSPLTNMNVTLTVATSVPNTNDALVFCIRRASSVYFIRGNSITDGQVINPFPAVAGPGHEERGRVSFDGVTVGPDSTTGSRRVTFAQSFGVAGASVFNFQCSMGPGTPRTNCRIGNIDTNGTFMDVYVDDPTFVGIVSWQAAL